jgi:hypothetical protein
MNGFAGLFGGSFEFLHNPYIPEGYKAAIVFKEDKWTYILEEAQQTIGRFYHLHDTKTDEEKAANYKKIWDNSTLGEKLLGNLNVMMEHLDGPIMVMSNPDIRRDCSLSFADLEVALYMKEVTDTYMAEIESGKAPHRI